MKVYVVMFEYTQGKENPQSGGGGFNWFTDELAAREEFSNEKTNADTFSKDGYYEVVFVEVPWCWGIGTDGVEKWVDEHFATLFDAATERYKA